MLYLEHVKIPEVLIIQEPGSSSPSILKSSHAVTTARDLLIYHIPSLTPKVHLDSHDASVIQVGSVIGC